MDGIWGILIDLVVIITFMAGFAQFRTPRGAWRGNLTAAAALTMAVLVVVARNPIGGWAVIVAAVVVGGGLGWGVSARVTMVGIPAMVAFQHGAGGVAAFLVSAVELTRDPVSAFGAGKVSGVLGLVIGAATFSGSVIAGGKLMGRLSGKPVVLPRHGALVAATLAVLAILCAVVVAGGASIVAWGTVALGAAAMWLGVAVSIRIGGADMPVLISFLNATAGLAAAFCGIVIQNRLLVVCGAVVAASGSVLTQIMCKAMHRSLPKVFLGFAPSATMQSWLPIGPARTGAPAAPEPGPPASAASSVASVPAAMTATTAASAPAAPAASAAAPVDPFAAAIVAAREATRVIIVPGYGMALAQAQFKVVELANLLEARGAEVCFAIHPVAGRMPGHMNVLLAEADASYDKLIELDDANPRFKDTDLALVVGACDVVNPAAVRFEGTPISGMPVLAVQEARRVLVCNLDARPGYSGVENILYSLPNVVLLFGDAARTLERISEGVRA